MTLIDEKVLQKKEMDQASKKILISIHTFQNYLPKHLPISNTQLNIIEHHHDMKMTKLFLARISIS